VVVVGLHPQIDALVVARHFCRLDEVLRQELLLLVEIVSGALSKSAESVSMHDFDERTTSISISKGPFHCLTSSVASYSFHFCSLPSPR
jgi:hypothetical protein